MMKVKANKTIGEYITEGKVYEVIGENKWQYRINQDNGDCSFCHKEHLTIIPDTPQIEVGSEWVNINDDEYIATITAVGNERLLYVGKFGGEASYRIDTWLMYYKPKPKTVTMYFYRHGKRLYAYDVEQICRTPAIFTREIEL